MEHLLILECLFLPLNLELFVRDHLQLHELHLVRVAIQGVNLVCGVVLLLLFFE